jgi:hypothetical protein
MKPYKRLIKENKNVLEQLQDILDSKQRTVIKFKNGTSGSVDMQTANVVLTVYNAMQQPDMKQKFERMINGDKRSFVKVVDFSWKQVR